MAAHEEKRVAACALDGQHQISRRERWLSLAERAMLAEARTDRGIELRYRPDRAVLAELTELVTLEQRCCAFASWKLEEVGAAIVLSVEADPATAPAVWALFDA